MSNVPRSLEDRFIGCLLGLAVGDALGANFEGQSAESVTARYPTARHLIQNPPAGEQWYTDDTQMAIGVAETLAACGRLDERHLCQRFAANYVAGRGYGRGARVIIEAMIAGEDYKWLAANHFPGGSFGNGAAMRVAPVGLMFHHNADRLWDEARLSALPTHTHPLGIEGAQLLALAVGLAVNSAEIDREVFLSALCERCQAVDYSGPLRRAARLSEPADIALFGNGIEAASSVVTAIAAFTMAPDSYEQTIGSAILLGGDTDTIAAMAGAISGAFLGKRSIPDHLLEQLEDREQGRSYIYDLAIQLHAAHLQMVAHEDESRI
jgi:poly(ADP-ribose) glycohydrolase ARH3